MKHTLPLMLVLCSMTTLGLAQMPIVETFNYEATTIEGQGSNANGWAGAWTINGSTENLKLVDGLNYTGLTTEGKSLAITAVDGAGTEAVRKLESALLDDGSTYWLSFLFEVENPTAEANSWQGFSLDVNGVGEQFYMGKLWGQNFMGINNPNPYLNAPSTYEYSSGLAWYVVKIKTSGSTEADTAYMWINPATDIEPAESAANVNAATFLNNGFDQIRLHLGQTAGIILKVDEVRIGTTWGHVTTEPVSGIEIINNNIQNVKVFPNPATNYTTIQYNIQGTENVILEVYNILGLKVATLVDNKAQSGTQTLEWQIDNLCKASYFYKLKAGNSISVGKIINK